MTSTPAPATAAGNMPRSVITTMMRSSPSEKPQAGTFAAEKHADEVVVAAAAAEASDQSGTAISMIAPV